MTHRSSNIPLIVPVSRSQVMHEINQIKINLKNSYRTIEVCFRQKPETSTFPGFRIRRRALISCPFISVQIAATFRTVRAQLYSGVGGHVQRVTQPKLPIHSACFGQCAGCDPPKSS